MTTHLIPRFSGVTRLIAVSCLGLFSLACGPNYVVIKQAEPNALYEQKSFSVEKIDFSKIKDVEEGHVTAIQAALEAELKDEASSLEFKSGGALSIHPRVTLLEGGITGGLMSSDAELHLVVQIKKGDEVLDEVEFRAKANQNDGVSIGGIPTSGYSDTARLEQCAETIGEELADYLNKRVSKK